ncbi:MAG: carbohydrate ABC transporter permease [Halothermotrichaceae bacterium]
MNNSNLLKPSNKKLFLLLLPPVIFFSFIIIFPIFNAIRYSFYQWSGGSNMVYLGFENYINLFNDSIFWHAFKNNIIIIILSIIGQIGIAFILASLLNTRFLNAKKFHRTVIFFPLVLSAVVVGFLWTMIYNNNYGILNWILGVLNLEFLIQYWLDDPKIVIYTVAIPIVWQYIGMYLIIFSSSFQNIPKEIFEVAEIDGVNWIQRLIHITLPLMYNTIIVAIMLCIAGNMKIFDHIYVMTGGGPGRSSMVMAQYAYNNSFTMFKLGYGSTISIGILVLSFGIILLTRKIMGGKKDEI